MDKIKHYQAVIDIAAFASQNHWCTATGGNFSTRLSPDTMAITASGLDKGHLKSDDIVTVDFEANVQEGNKKPSAETLVHAALYQLDPTIQTVLHTHSVVSTVLSLCISENILVLQQYEMLKVLRGYTTHDVCVDIPILANTQNMPALASHIKKIWPMQGYAFLVRGHGCYCWGNSMEEAKRHMEVIEFLFSCELEKRKLT